MRTHLDEDNFVNTSHHGLLKLAVPKNITSIESKLSAIVLGLFFIKSVNGSNHVKKLTYAHRTITAS